MKLVPVRIFILFFPLITFSTPVRAEKSTMSKEKWTKSDFLFKSISMYVDTADLNFDEVSRLPAGSFKNYSGEHLLKNEVYWFWLTLKNENKVDQDFYMHFNSMISDILLFRTIGDSICEATRGGSLVPLSVRSAKGPIKDKVPFSAPLGQQTNLFLRICNQVDHQYTLKNIVIVPRREFENGVNQNSVLQGIFIGMMFLILLLNFILYFFSHQRLYALYALYILFTALLFLYYFGFSERYLFGDYPKADLTLFWSVYVAQLVYLIFFRELLKEESIPIWSKSLKYFTWFIFLFCMLILATSQIDYSRAVAIADVYTIFNALFVIISFILFFKKVKITTRIVLTGSTIMVMGGLTTTFISFAEVSIANMDFYQTGVFIELILFTVAINYMYTKDHLDKVNMLNHNSELELEKIHIDNENLKLKQELESKNRQLTSKLIELTEKETIIADIIQKLSQLDHEDVDKRKIHNLLTSIKSGQSCHNWNEFEVCFDLTHPNFYCGLNARFPKLTANEKKLCAFLKLNFSTKEMSIITGKSVNTIDVGRSRLRRKMGMVSDENLQSFIAHFN